LKALPMDPGTAMTSIEMISHKHELYGRPSAAGPWSSMALFLFFQSTAWIILPAIVLSSPKSNTVELALWARDWFIVNYKHPGLPAWLLASGYSLFGTHLWVSLLASQLCIGAAYAFVFLLGRDLMDARAALLGTLILPAVTYFTVGTLKYNHNMV